MMNNRKIGRRYFIKGTVSSSLAVILGTAYALTGCTNTRKPSEQNVKEDTSQENGVSECDDYSNIDEVNLRKREQLGYVKKTATPESRCNNCKLWIAPKQGQKCGGCMLFKGPVYDEGYCTYWAPQD